MEALKSRRLPYLVAATVALLDTFSVVLMLTFQGGGGGWWSLVHRPMSLWLLPLAIGNGVSAHDPLRWNDYAYFALNVVYLAVAAFFLSVLARRLWSK